MRFFAPDASWNRTADELGIDTSSAVADYPQRLMLYGGGPDPQAQRFDLKFRDYSVPIYDAAKATTTAKCFQLNWAAREMAFGVPNGQTIPWNPAWKPGTGTDQIMCVVNSTTGEAFYLWGYQGSAGWNCQDWFGPNVRAGLWAPWTTKIACGTVHRQPNIFTAKDGSTVSARGMGIDKAALVLRASEVQSGSVDHALCLTIGNPGYPPMTLRRPATKLEYQSAAQIMSKGLTPFVPGRTLPSGVRFRVRKTRAEVKAWVAWRKFPYPLSSTMETIAWCLCTHGFIVGETGKWGIGIETDGMCDPVSAAEWKKLGIVDDGPNPMMGGAGLLAGLFTAADLEVVKEPV